MPEKSMTLYAQVGGFDVVYAVTCRWHDLCLQDSEAAHPFEHELHPYHNERLAAYLAEALGGPKLYSAGYGDESYVQQLHACNGVHIELDEACMKQFDQALQDVGVADSAAEQVSAYFRRATENQRAWAGPDVKVPAGLPFNLA